jgi:hypothetical protein
MCRVRQRGVGKTRDEEEEGEDEGKSEKREIGRAQTSRE